MDRMREKIEKDASEMGLDDMEKHGLIHRNGEYRQDEHGGWRPGYVVAPPPTREEIQNALDELEELGLIHRSDEYRRGRDGIRRPVYKAQK